MEDLSGTVLLGTVGSTAYKLNTETSDIDQLGIYIAPRDHLFGLRTEKVTEQSRVTIDPDKTLHEIGKAFSLALKCNPTVLEIFHLDDYAILDPVMEEIIEKRSLFYSEKRIRAAYSGYVKDQATRLLNRLEEGRKGFDPKLAKRTAKHGRHCYRLLLQGHRLLTLGQLQIDMSEYREEIFSMGDLAENEPQVFHDMIMKKVEILKNTSSILPVENDYDAVNNILINIRKKFYYG